MSTRYRVTDGFGLFWACLLVFAFFLSFLTFFHAIRLPTPKKKEPPIEPSPMQRSTYLLFPFISPSLSFSLALTFSARTCGKYKDELDRVKDLRWGERDIKKSSLLHPGALTLIQEILSSLTEKRITLRYCILVARSHCKGQSRSLAISFILDSGRIKHKATYAQAKISNRYSIELCCHTLVLLFCSCFSLPLSSFPVFR